MKMVPYDYRKIENLKGYKKTKNEEILDEFLESGETCVEIVEYTNKTPYSSANSFNTHIRKRKLQNMIIAIVRNKRVFLVRIDKIEGKV